MKIVCNLLSFNITSARNVKNNTENKERIFNTIREISMKTPSRKADHIRNITIICMQSEQNFKER